MERKHNIRHEVAKRTYSCYAPLTKFYMHKVVDDRSERVAYEWREKYKRYDSIVQVIILLEL